MKTIPFNESARDVEHDASVEVPDNMRDVLVSSGDRGWTEIGYYIPSGETWAAERIVTIWRELPAPPKPTPKTVPHSLAHWHDPKVERPEPGKPIVTIRNSLLPHLYGKRTQEVPWDVVLSWTYVPEYLR